MDRIIELEVLEGFQIRVRFEDGTEGIVSLEEDLVGPVFEPLRDPRIFRQVQLDEFGVPCWPNGADIAPDALYEQLRSAGKSGSRRP